MRQTITGIIEEKPVNRIDRIVDDPIAILHYLYEQSEFVKQKVLAIFEECVLNVNFLRKKIDRNRISMSPEYLYTAFSVLIEAGQIFPSGKVSEILKCFAFVRDNNKNRDVSLLNMLLETDESLWSDCVIELVEDDLIDNASALRYLYDIKSDIYIAACKKRLLSGQFLNIGLKPLYDYWQLFKPPDYIEVLWMTYLTLRRPVTNPNPSSQQFQILGTLLFEDDEYAWADLEFRLSRSDVIFGSELGEPWWKGLISNNSFKINTLAEWFLLTQIQKLPKKFLSDDISGLLLESIKNIGGQCAIDELNNLINNSNDLNLKYLSFHIIQIEDKMINDSVNPWEPGNLLDFILKDKFGIVNSDRDLFVWVRESLEEIKDTIELRGEGTPGFWNQIDRRREPKHEPECQSVLWALIRPKIESYGLSNIEEHFIGPNRADLLVEKIVNDGNNFQILLELKVARKNYGEAELIDPIETQLYKTYMFPKVCKFGIYVVLWFKESSYNYPAKWETPDDLLSDIIQRSKKVENEKGVNIACYIIDLTTPYRR